MPGTVWQLNDNFVVLAIEGVLNMLCSTGCQELSILHKLSVSSNAFIIEDVPTKVQKVVGCLIRSCWKKHGLLEALRRLEMGNTETVSDANPFEICVLFHNA
jgi:hypothetical protein